MLFRSCFTRTGGERRRVACAWTGAVRPEHWSGDTREVDFFDIKGIVERLAHALRLDITLAPTRAGWLAPGRSAAVMVGDIRIGTVGQLAPAVADAHGIPAGDAVYVAELDLDAAEALAPRTEPRVEPLPRFPSSSRDISILVADTLPSATVRTTIRQAAPSTLARVVEFDRYQGKGIPEGQVDRKSTRLNSSHT